MLHNTCNAGYHRAAPISSPHLALIDSEVVQLVLALRAAVHLSQWRVKSS
jgi:hypothetical protein